MKQPIRVIHILFILPIILGIGCGSGGSDTVREPVFWGIAYGPYRANQTPEGGPQPTADQIRADIPRLALLGGRLRTYTVADAHSQIPSLAHEKGLKTWAGGWIGTNAGQNTIEVQRLINVSTQPGVEVVVVGNEAILRNDVSTDQLITYIRQVKNNVRVPVAYADTWDVLQRHPEVVQEVDIALANIHPYWDNISVSDAANYIWSRFNELRIKYPDTQIVIGETGWPSSGSPHGQAAAGEQQQQVFFAALLGVIIQHPEMHVFAFEAFDESFKNEANVGSHWGLCNLDGSTKNHLISLIPAKPPDPLRSAAAGQILVDGKLSPGLSLGVYSSSGSPNWTSFRDDYLKVDYTSGQQWGAIGFIVGTPTADAIQRGTRDFTSYTSLIVEIRGLVGGERLSIGAKTDSDPDDGQEPKVAVANLTTDWKTVRIPLSGLAHSPHYPTTRFGKLYMVEFVFEPGTAAETVLVRNIQFSNDGG